MLQFNNIYIHSFIKEILSEINFIEKSIALDLGCGERPYKDLLNNKFASVVNADYEKRCKDLDCYADAKNTPFATDTFDAVLLSEVIEHVENPGSVVNEIYRILKPGGYLILTWPLIYGLHEIPTDFIRYTEFGMDQLLRKNSLIIYKIKRIGDILAVIHTLIGQILSAIIESFKRARLMGRIVRPVCQLIEYGIEISYKIHYHFARRSERLNPTVVGSGLKGPRGWLALWTLGYCVMAQKKIEKPHDKKSKRKSS